MSSNSSWHRICDFDHSRPGIVPHPRRAILSFLTAVAFSFAIWCQEWSRVLIFVNPDWVGNLQNDHVRRPRQALGSNPKNLDPKPFKNNVPMQKKIWDDFHQMCVNQATQEKYTQHVFFIYSDISVCFLKANFWLLPHWSWRHRFAFEVCQY